MKKTTLILILLCLVAGMAAAGPVTRSAARSAATTAVQCYAIASTIAPGQQSTVSLVDVTAEAGLAGLYLFNYTAGDMQGFVLVSGDDIASPILALSDEGHFVPGLENPAFYWWVGQYQHQIIQGRAQSLAATPQVQQQWEELLSGKALDRTTERLCAKSSPDSARIRQLLGNMIWNQGDPYNRYCPKKGSKQAVTGCVATAYSMIMNYWNYPEHGFGYHSYDGTDNPAAYPGWRYGELSADFEHTYYDWEHIGDYALTNSPDSIWQGIATLCYQVGVALDMNYSPDGSGCWSLREYAIFDTSLHLDPSVGSEYRIPKHFGYKFSYAGMRDSIGDDSTWTRMLVQSLIDSMPIYYAGWARNNSEAGHSATSGHGFIIDGCYAAPGEQTLFHLNWGWGGSYNANFALDALTPGGSDFTQWHGAVIGLEPDTSYHGYNYEAIAPVTRVRTGTPWGYSEGSRLIIRGLCSQPATLYDLQGRTVATLQGQRDSWTLNLPAGLYLLRTPGATVKLLHR